MKKLLLLACAAALVACDYPEPDTTLPLGAGTINVANGSNNIEEGPNKGKPMVSPAGSTIITDPVTHIQYIVLFCQGHIAITPRLGTPIQPEVK